jgi:hypothetical protein
MTPDNHGLRQGGSPRGPTLPVTEQKEYDNEADD